MKAVKRVLVLAAAVALLAIAAIVFSLLRSVPPLAGHERLPGLGAAVEVTWDSLAVPHISAASDSDAFMALGYLHARDRLWAMEVMRRAAEGRLSEIMGSATIETDKYLRSLDMVRAAESSLALAPPEARAVLEAYARGINRWISAPTRPLPPEFRILRVRPEPWTVRQSVELGRLMAWDLAASGTELSLARALARVGPERLAEILPAYPDSGPSIIAAGTGEWRGRTARPSGGRSRERTESRLPGAVLAAAEIPVVPDIAQRVLEMSVMSRASNSWVIGGARTRSGKPILANDPHLGLRAPSLWYLAAIESPSYHVAGVTLPGLPAVVIGRNRRIAWGLTNMSVDDVDYVIERLRADSSEVLTTDGWRPVEVQRESIFVKGRPPVPFALRRTAHGPLVAGTVPGVPGAGDSGEVRGLAMRWNALEPSDELSAVMGVDRAGSWDEFLAAVKGFKAPEQNWIYADVDGNIGYTASGNVPVRHSGNGLLPTPGWTDEGRWERFLDFDELPRVFNPPEGFIVTANNRIIGREYPWLLTADWELPYRAQRIRELVEPARGLALRDVQRMQMDTLDVFARAVKGVAARAAAAAGHPELAESLGRWDGTAGADRTEPTLFWTWYRALRAMTFDDQLGGGYRPSSRLNAWLLAGAGGEDWFDDVSTPRRETLDTLSLAAMRRAIPLAQGRRWGDAHVTISRHALGSVTALDVLLRLNAGPLPRAGSPYTVDVADFPGTTPPFTNVHAASFRQVVDLSAPEDGALILTTGQSGNPLSRHYRDQVRRWWRGELWTVPLSRDRVASVGTLDLVP